MNHAMILFVIASALCTQQLFAQTLHRRNDTDSVTKQPVAAVPIERLSVSGDDVIKLDPKTDKRIAPDSRVYSLAYNSDIKADRSAGIGNEPPGSAEGFSCVRIQASHDKELDREKANR